MPTQEERINNLENQITNLNTQILQINERIQSLIDWCESLSDRVSTIESNGVKTQVAVMSDEIILQKTKIRRLERQKDGY
ncbi:hypothetical protein [Campylobacter mucosalis]|uniref:Uncharacterized protein n=1 Tax=Campylobacter mucosalis CCUG 21559 TaxID=1032067 RepID=A0A6G5QEV8_9BACT|nr:hypothetical protein [Campylobacter mucosalis]QCD44129.1 hypothetical protein CMUC_0315 [Campylobacter mucosalis CCUG 21559]QCD44718.1 hypothetical protein CMUC_0929 [Campylobacter mucosalis CCUG 21559]